MPWFIHNCASNRGHLKYMFLILSFGAKYQIIISRKTEKLKIPSSYLRAVVIDKGCRYQMAYFHHFLKTGYQ